MAQIFVNLPAPAGNGTGAPADMSAFGPLKTIAVSGGANCTVNVEMSNDAGAVFWAPVCTVGPTGGTFQFSGVARWMRVRVSQFLGSAAPVINVGGTNEGSSFLELPVPADDGSGAAIDTSAMGPFKTIQVGDTFRGSLQIDVSEDGAMNWATIASFSGPGTQTLVFAAKYMRVTRNGIPVINPGSPVCNVGATFVTPGDLGVAISAGSQMASSGTVQFKNSNGVSFGMSDSTGITASMDAFRSIAAAGATASGPSLLLSNANGVTFGIVGGTLTASVQTAGGTATGVGISAGTELATTGAVVFSNSNNVTFGMHNQTVTASVSVPPAFGIAAGGVTISSGTAILSNSNGVSFGIAGSTVTASAYQPAFQRNVGFTATGGETQITVTFTPAAAASDYKVYPACDGVSYIVGIDAPAASRSVSAFVAIPSGSLAAADHLAFLLYKS